MAKRYKYSFAQQKQAGNGIYSVVLAGVSFSLFLAAVAASFFLREYLLCQPLVWGLCVGAILLAFYGFVMGLIGYTVKNRSHSFCTAGTIANGLLMVGWLGLYLVGA